MSVHPRTIATEPKYPELLDLNSLDERSRKASLKGIFDRETARKFRHLLEQGGSVEAAQLYREFRGHDPEPAALLRQLDIIEN